MEDPAISVGHRLRVNAHGSTPSLKIGVQPLQMDRGSIVGIADVHQHLQDTSHGGSLSVNSGVRFHRTHCQHFLVSALSAPQHSCSCSEFDVVRKCAPFCVALQAIQVQGVQVRTPDGLQDAFLLHWAARGRHACVAAAVHQALAHQGPAARVVANDHFTVRLLSVGLQDDAGTALAQNIAARIVIKGKAAPCWVHEGLPAWPEEGRQVQVHAAANSRGTRASCLQSVLVVV
mmetsp:Transcript_42555/g.99227  ORF Transcript_42555/g.99227 Transcript_42555/m.99227 type:complete len:232 (-) Transcript_42555:97-792(-)